MRSTNRAGKVDCSAGRVLHQGWFDETKRGVIDSIGFVIFCGTWASAPALGDETNPGVVDSMLVRGGFGWLERRLAIADHDLGWHTFPGLWREPCGVPQLSDSFVDS